MENLLSPCIGKGGWMEKRQRNVMMIDWPVILNHLCRHEAAIFMTGNFSITKQTLLLHASRDVGK